MEPVGIVVFSALMASVSLQLIVEGVTDLIKGGSEFTLKVQSIVLVGCAIGMFVLARVCVVRIEKEPIFIFFFLVGTKLILFLYCRVLTSSPSAMTLATDHFNDLLVNGFGITMALLGYYIRWWLDPVGSLIVALIILRSWTMTAYGK
jgi:divalent metal cation (Fe/Co/Zn/Cd) transporter